MDSSGKVVCPNDKSEMVEGSLFAYQRVGLAKQIRSVWFGAPRKTEVKAFYCPKCGKVELYAVTEKGEMYG